jgi:hypothetical protein
MEKVVTIKIYCVSPKESHTREVGVTLVSLGEAVNDHQITKG